MKKILLLFLVSFIPKTQAHVPKDQYVNPNVQNLYQDLFYCELYNLRAVSDLNSKKLNPIFPRFYPLDRWQYLRISSPYQNDYRSKIEFESVDLENKPCGSKIEENDNFNIKFSQTGKFNFTDFVYLKRYNKNNSYYLTEKSDTNNKNSVFSFAFKKNSTKQNQLYKSHDKKIYNIFYITQEKNKFMKCLKREDWCYSTSEINDATLFILTDN